MQKRQLRRWYLPPSTPDALQRVSNLLGGELGQFGVGNRDQPFPPLLEPHRGRSDFDFKATVARPNLQRLAGFQAQGLSQWLGNDDPARSIDGSFHGAKFAIKMALLQPLPRVSRQASCAMHAGHWADVPEET